MSKPNPLDPKVATTKATEISADELTARMEKQELIHDEPLRKAVKVLEGAIEKVVKSLGVNVEHDIPSQLKFLNIHIKEVENYPGIFIMIDKGIEIEPYAWVSDAIMMSDGTYKYEIQWFRENRLETIGGVKVV
jgi:hypothetical protein